MNMNAYLHIYFRAIEGLRSSSGNENENEEDNENDKEEENHRRAIEQEKIIYKDSFERLRVLKPEIEHIRKVRIICFIIFKINFTI